MGPVKHGPHKNHLRVLPGTTSLEGSSPVGVFRPIPAVVCSLPARVARVSGAVQAAGSLWWVLKLCNLSTITREYTALHSAARLDFLDVILSAKPTTRDAQPAARYAAGPHLSQSQGSGVCMEEVCNLYNHHRRPPFFGESSLRGAGSLPCILCPVVLRWLLAVGAAVGLAAAAASGASRRSCAPSWRAPTTSRSWPPCRPASRAAPWCSSRQESAWFSGPDTASTHFSKVSV